MVTDRTPNVKAFPVEQRNPVWPKKKKEKRWSHQDELREAIGKKLRIQTNGPLVDATLLEADAFTLKVQFEDGVLTLFKHAIHAYQVL